MSSHTDKELTMKKYGDLIPEHQCKREIECVKGTNYNRFSLIKKLPLLRSIFDSSIAMSGIFNKGSDSDVTSKSELIDGLTVNTKIGTFGEDTVISTSMSKERSPRLIIIGVLDGHGDNMLVSKEAGKRYLGKFRLNYSKIVKEALTDHTLLKKTLALISSEVDTEIIPTVIVSGGCTMSITGIIESHTDRVVFNMNLGDSSTYMRTNDVVQQINTDHSADNIEAYSAHYFAEKSIGNTPSPIVYGRFNIEGPLGVTYPNWNKQYIPYVMFEETSDGSLRVEKNAEKWMRKRFTDYIGGIQSVRKYVGTNESGKTEALPGYGHVNWGSTIMGDMQCIKSHGDMVSTRTHKISHIPDINIYCPPPHEDVTIVAGSDGLWDIMWTMEVFDIISGNDSISSCMEKIIDTIKSKCQIEEFQKMGYTYSELDGGKIKAMWDDVSIVVYQSPGDLFCKNLYDHGIPIHSIEELQLNNKDVIGKPDIYRSVSAGTTPRKRSRFSDI